MTIDEEFYAIISRRAKAARMSVSAYAHQVPAHTIEASRECVCGHIANIHSNGCSGWLTLLDTGTYEGPCDCREFLRRNR